MLLALLPFSSANSFTSASTISDPYNVAYNLEQC